MRRTLLLAVIVLAAVAPASARAQTPISVTVGSTPTGQPMSPGFVGVSLELRALHVYTGRNPDAVNPVLVHLLQGLAPGQSPVLRIGGNSADASWWPIHGVIPPQGVSYAITPGWIRMTRALASDLHAQLIVGLNLAARRPALAVAEARALMQGVGRQYIDALEIGNEPDLYGQFSWYRNRRGKPFFSRGKRYSLTAFIHEFSRWRRALPPVPVAGPAFAELTWLSGLDRFIAAEPGLKVVTVHRYPLRAGTADPNSPNYTSIPNLLADRSSSGLAQQVAPYVPVAHARGIPLRVAEMNSAAHSGQRGVSDTFAAALWALDTLFNMASVGVDGVNFHSLPHAAYELFTFSQTPWRALVHPEYYGMLLFAQAFPPGAQLLPVTAPDGPLKVWAVRTADGQTHVVLINKDPVNAYDVQVEVQSAGVFGEGTLIRLTAPSIDATTGVSLGGQTFGSSTTTGTLGPQQPELVLGSGDTFDVQMPAASAAMLVP